MALNPGLAGVAGVPGVGIISMVAGQPPGSGGSRELINSVSDSYSIDPDSDPEDHESVTGSKLFLNII